MLQLLASSWVRREHDNGCDVAMFVQVYVNSFVQVYVNTFTAQGSTHTATADVALQHQQASRESLIPDPLHPPPETSLRLTASPSFELRFALFASPLSDGP